MVEILREQYKECGIQPSKMKLVVVIKIIISTSNAYFHFENCIYTSKIHIFELRI